MWFSGARSLATTAAAAAALLLSGGVVPLDAQYFGRNNPQYRTFDWQVLRTQHFDIYYYPEAEVGIRDAGRMAERWYERLSRILGHEFRVRQPLILYASHADFQQTNILGSPVGEGTGGVTESLKQRIIMPLAHTYAETDHVLGHELVHAFQYDLSGLGRSAGSIDAGGRAFATAPLWFTEGMAEYLTLGPVDSHTAMWLRDAALTGELPSLRRLATDPRVFPYRYGHALWAYITGRWGDAVVGQILRSVGRGMPYDQAIQSVLGITMQQLSDDWQASVRRTYLPLLADFTEASEAATPLVTRELRGGRVNIGPAVSPDGSRVAFLSERGRFDIELWLADASTGQVLRRIVRGPALDTHFGSLNFIASAGSFSPDGRQVAFSALRRGRGVIALVDVETSRIVRELRMDDIAEVTNPDWSPDGRSIAFSGSRGGQTNLYVFDLESGATRQLTEGRNADLMPVWSPDGASLAFVTDRGGATDMDALSFDGYRVALLDVATGQIRQLPGSYPGRNFNPVWTRDGLFFISDRDGVANVYRVDVATGALSQVTRIFQGVSGYTQLSPALAGARNADRLVFSVFDRGGYNLYRMDGAPQLAGTPVPAAVAGGQVPVAGHGGEPVSTDAPPPAQLPPTPRPAEAPYQRVAAYLADEVSGLPSVQVAAAWTPEPYRPRLSIDYVGQPQAGFSAGGAVGQGGLYGGVAALWSDMLAHHTIYGVAQAQGRLDEFGFQAAYLYRPNRWDFGVAAQRIPYISAGRAQGFDEQAGLFRDQLVTFRTFDWQLTGLAQLPRSRSQRIEFSAGVRRIARDIRIQENVTPARRLPNGQIEATGQTDYQERTEDAPNFHLVQGTAALVFDNAVFGYTSPVAGQRYRFEAAPTLGDFRFVSALADYRRYLWVRPFTLAARGLHYGRYGLGGQDENALGPVFLGQPSLVRGYEYGWLADRCVAALRGGAQAAEPCLVLDQLFGSRIGVANAEFRFPLISGAVVGTGMGLPPVEGFVFGDAGVAWTAGTSPVFETGVPTNLGERGILASTGVGARINVFGYMIVEIDYVRPLTTDRGWHWVFALQPGF
jgi:Tol biopolymer transport system component